MNEDLYLNFAQMQDDKAVIQAYVFSAGLFGSGPAHRPDLRYLIALVPSKIKLQYARTEVVGITRNMFSGAIMWRTHSCVHVETRLDACP